MYDAGATKKVRRVLSREDILAIARCYPTRKALREADPSVYQTVFDRDMERVAFAHMRPAQRGRSDAELIEIARRHQSRKSLVAADQSAYRCIRDRGLAAIAFAHMGGSGGSLIDQAR